MVNVNTIQELQSTDLELLAALGISDCEDLAARNVTELTEEIIRANIILKITKHCPSEDIIRMWVDAAARVSDRSWNLARGQASFSKIASSRSSLLPVNSKDKEEVRRLLALAPFAIPVQEKYMVENQIRIADIPPGLPLDNYSETFYCRRDETQFEYTNRHHSDSASQDPVDEGLVVHSKTSEVKQQPEIVTDTKHKDRQNRRSRTRQTLESTNRGRDRNSRRYIRGLLHPSPWTLRLGAFSSLLMFVHVPLGILCMFLLILSIERLNDIIAFSIWILVIPVTLPLVILAYLGSGFRAKCRVCGQKIFVIHASQRHRKSHHFTGLGYIVPLSCHLLVFNWFRCSSCGTPIRLKK